MKNEQLVRKTKESKASFSSLEEFKLQLAFNGVQYGTPAAVKFMVSTSWTDAQHYIVVDGKPVLFNSRGKPIDDTVRQLVPSLFWSSSFHTFVMPEHVTTISDSCFSSSLLHEIIFNSKLESIQRNAFSMCLELRQDIVFPKSLICIHPKAFADANILSIVLPKRCETIGMCAFYRCEELVKADMGASKVKSIAESAFHGCHALAELSLPSKLEQIEDIAFDGCKQLTHVVLPASLNKIGWCSFRDCFKLETVEFLGNPGDIDPYAFRNTPVQRVIMHKPFRKGDMSRYREIFKPYASYEFVDD